ncbi:putative ankyrin repeat protein RF_0381 [Patella vulgata]|uniref:putative ankyrin repeat protein RF_0381 n=1 Tax=Patella vulgata TaxID=6465 RepID=UPI0024A7DA6E|nr:putative ankyrin repeat protein RF_0381 [Patella vulgata]
MSGCEPEDSLRKSQRYKEQLREAVNTNDTVEVERILQEYVEWGHDRLPNWIWVELCEAALKNRCLPMVELLLPSVRISNNFVDVDTNIKLIEAAIKSDFIEGVKFLQSKGTPLYFAHSTSRYNWSALTECVLNNSVEVLKYLLELKYPDQNPEQEEMLLMLCCQHLNIESLKILLISELINTINQQKTHRQYSALHYCISGKEWLWEYGFDERKPERVLDCVQLLVESGADVNLEDIDGKTPIQLAAERGMVTTVIYLAERGAEINIGSHQGTLFHCLAESGHMSDSYDECVQLLITKGVDINKLNLSNKTPLYLAVCKENEEMVKSLIKSGCDVNIKVGDESVLMTSIRRRRKTISEILIQAECDVNTPDKNGVTPLMECIQTDNQVLVKQLIDHGAFVNAKDNKGCFVLEYLRFYYHQKGRSSSADTVKIMIDAGADIHKCNKLLCTAINAEDYESASMLIEHGINVNTVGGNGDNPLALASEKVKLELVKLLTTKDCDINHQNLRGETALHKAIEGSIHHTYYHDKEKIIQTLLLQNGMNVNLSDVDGRTALTMAVRNGERSITEDLLKAGADIDHCDTSRHQTPLIIAVTNHDTVMANILLKAGADLKPRDGSGRNAIHLVALLNVSLNLDDLLKYSNLRSEAESTLNATDLYGKTSLMVAAERKPRAMVKELLRAGCNINLQDQGGKTALMFAIDNKDETILSLLLQKSADYNICDNNGQTALMVAVEKQKEILCENLLTFDASVNHVDNNGNTALAVAVKMNNEKIVNSLLKAGADVNHGDNIGVTPLMNVNNRSIFESLMKAGADINQRDNNGRTALMTAARNCNSTILECLLQAGADVNKTDTHGRSAIHAIMVGRGRGRKWINSLKLLLINKCHVSLDTPGEDGKTLFQWLLERNNEDLIWYLVTENCSLEGLDLSKVKDKFQFPDVLMLSKILFESGAPKSEIETIILLSVLNTGFSRSTYNLGESKDKQLDEFRGFCKSRSLKSRCRREIRNCIGSGISSKISQVGLPKYLQDYVVLKDLIPEKYFTLAINDKDDDDRTDNIDGLMFALMASSAFPIYGGYNSDDSYDGNYYYEPDYYSDNYYD